MHKVRIGSCGVPLARPKSSSGLQQADDDIKLMLMMMMCMKKIYFHFEVHYISIMNTLVLKNVSYNRYYYSISDAPTTVR